MKSKMTLYLLSAVILAAAFYFGHVFFSDNFHEVVRGELYRSGQLNAAQIAYYQKTKGIKSIINLRGHNPGLGWYDEEVAASKKLGLTHIDLRLSSKQEMSRQQVIELLAAMRDAPKPLLIHCHSGANRTGLAAALYLVAVKGATPAQAQAQLSLKYGHFNFRFSPAYAMDDTLRRFIRAHETGAAIPVMTVADAR